MRVLAAIAVLALVTGAASPGLAQTDERGSDDDAPGTDRPAVAELSRLKDITLAEIDRRLAALDRLAVAVDTAERLTPDHRAELASQVSTAQTTLLELRTAVTSAQTLLELGALIPRIVNDYWVFALIVPKVYEVIAADAIVAVAGDFEGAQAQIAAVIERAAAAGFDVESAAAALDRAKAGVIEARALAIVVPADVLPIGPDQMPDSGETLVSAARTLEAAFELLSESAFATRAAVSDLRAAVDQAET